ncbi:MAG: dTDP-4-dehydrorhamnose 3,5-epimerase [Pseudomonadota bacterium]
MKFTPTPLAGAFVIDIETLEDERGFFARSVCDKQFAEYGLNAHFVQQSMSHNLRTGTLRGLHFQTAPYAEDKLVRVTAGAVFDVIVDLRRDSNSFGDSFSIELSADNHRQLYIPRGFAHGFQTLMPATEILYQMTVPFRSEAAAGLRWDDPALAIAWPACTDRIISDKDGELPFLNELS